MPIFDTANLPYWVLLGIGVALFLVVIFAGGGDDADLDADLNADLDVDLDADLDADIDVSGPVDLDTDVDSDGEFSPLEVLKWFGVGRAPLLLLLATDFSLWGLLGWMGNVFLGGILGTLLGNLVGGVVLLGSFGLALVLGGQIARPLGRIFASFGEDSSGDRLVGCFGIVSTARIPDVAEGRIGQVDVLDASRNRVTVNAILPAWASVSPQRGDTVLVIERSAAGYLVIAKDSLDQERWLNGPRLPQDSR
ncbi:MAG: DUF1449 family protein [Elainellaceae cyanobacterium]